MCYNSSMGAEELKELLAGEPFEPFRVITSSGKSYEVRDPQSVALMKSRIFIALPTDRWAFVPFLHISSVEPIPAA